MAGNTFITPSVIAALGLSTLYDQMVLAGLVSRDYDSSWNGHVGDTVNVKVPATFKAKTFVRANGIEVQDATESSIPLVLSTVKDVSFGVTSEDLTLSVQSFQEQLLAPAMMALVEDLDQTLANALIAAAKGPGGGGTIAIGSGSASDVYISAREHLTRSKMSLSNRNAVLSPEAVSTVLGEDLFVQSQQAGTTTGLREGDQGRVMGINNYESGTFGYGPGNRGSSDGVVFHRDSFVLASRPLAAPMGAAPSTYSVQSFRGLSLRVCQQYSIEKKQDTISCDWLYGVAAVRPAGIIALDFGQGS